MYTFACVLCIPMVSSLRSQEMIRQKLRKLRHVTMGGIVGSELGRLRTFGSAVH